MTSKPDRCKIPPTDQERKRYLKKFSLCFRSKFLRINWSSKTTEDRVIPAGREAPSPPRLLSAFSSVFVFLFGSFFDALRTLARNLHN